MAFLADIGESWRRPAVVLRRHLERERSEPLIFTFLFVFLLLAFVAQWPQAARVTAENPEIPLSPQLLGRAMALVATIPFWYALAGLGHLIARALGGRGSWYAARVALFWALATVTPLMLLSGLVAGMIGPGPQLTLVGVLTFLAFLGFWIVMMVEAEGGADGRSRA